MTGFFDWGELPEQTSGSQIVTCPNCGQHVNRSRASTHECESGLLVDYHLIKLRCEFKLHVGIREPALPDSFVDDGAGLAVWAPFEEWLATPFGMFEREWAESTRP